MIRDVESASLRDAVLDVAFAPDCENGVFLVRVIESKSLRDFLEPCGWSISIQL
jgi:hypothetical protein